MRGIPPVRALDDADRVDVGPMRERFSVPPLPPGGQGVGASRFLVVLDMERTVLLATRRVG